MPARKRVKGMYTRGEWWYWQPPTVKGEKRPNAIALGTKDYVDGVTTVTQLQAKNEVSRAAKQGTLAEVLPRYYKAKSADTLKTRRGRVLILDNFMEILGNPKVASITADTIADWRAHLASAGGSLRTKRALGKATMTSYLIVVKAFCNWAKEEGFMTNDPIKHLNRHTRVTVTRINDFHSLKEREALLSTEAKPHIELLGLLGYLQGLREQEMLAMTPKWIWISEDWEHGSISVIDTVVTRTDGTVFTWSPKGKRRRVIPMHKRLIEFFRKHPPKGPWVVRPDKELWPVDDKISKRYDARKAFQNWAKRAGVARTNFHIMRHTFGTQLAIKGVPLVEIAALLGDTLIVAQSNYAGYCPKNRSPLAVL